VIVALALLGSVICAAQLKIHSFEKAEVLQKSENRPVVVFIYTDWCAYCQAMKNTAFIDRQIAKKLNDQFYFVALNGEEKRSIRFNNHWFRYKPNGANTGTHELAEALGAINKKLAYPALVILNSRYEIIFQHSGVLTGKALQVVLNEALRSPAR
jgi:thioredoxin-related protein